MLDVVRAPVDEGLILAWRSRVQLVAAELGWPAPQCIARPHAGGVLLAFSAPADQLLLATEVNEWALCAALFAQDSRKWAGLQAALVAAIEATDSDAAAAVSFAPVMEQTAALSRFAKLSSLEASSKLRALLKAAADRALPYFLDDAEFTLGAGTGSSTYALSSLPAIDAVPWTDLHDIPTAVITGSNGKTTSVRLVAACARANGWRAGYNCTDGVFIDAEPRATGDYSGPAGARMVMRDRRVQAAVLEAARGGILRRGVAIARAAVALITNISSDHFGEYGIDDLGGLADVKLSVAATVSAQGSLVLNADDALLRRKSSELAQRFGRAPTLAWFALDAELPFLQEQRGRGAATCGVRGGRLWLQQAGAEHDLGQVAAMPLSLGGIAAYNIANLAGAALTAAILGVAPATIGAVFARFGATAADNPGRMMRFEYRGAQVLIDYAHNPEGLRGFLSVATQLRGDGRLGLLLGHAGNRKDADIAEVARTAASFEPELIVVKEDEAHLRGRPAGEIPRIIQAELQRLGVAESNLALRDNELDAARYALDWARPGDVLALPLHSPAARAAVIAILKG